MKISLKTKLITFAKGKNGWINGGEFERLAMNEGFKSSNAGRRCREMANLGILERRISGKSVEYRYKTQDITTTFRPEFTQLKKLELQKII